MLLVQGGNGRESSYEALAVRQYALTKNIPLKSYDCIDQIGTEELSSASLLEGSVEFIIEGLRRLNKPIPEPDYYPEVLTDFLDRQVWKSTYIQAVILADTKPVFVKSQAWKALTGCVITPTEQPYGTPDTLPVWLSDVISIQQEYRVYVQNNKIVYVARYDEHESDDQAIDIDKIQKAITLMATQNPREAYAFDWGITSSGNTVLIENNDGWAIGRYKPMPYDIYTRFLIARWKQLTC